MVDKRLQVRLPGCGCIVYALAIVGILYLVGCVG